VVNQRGLAHAAEGKFLETESLKVTRQKQNGFNHMTRNFPRKKTLKKATKIDTNLDLQNAEFKIRAKLRETAAAADGAHTFYKTFALLRIQQLNGFTSSQVLALRKTQREVPSQLC